MNREGSLRRIRRGLYLVTPPGAAPLHPLVIASALDETAVVSGWAALHHHGLTEQIPRVIEVTTTRRLRGLTYVAGRPMLTFEGERFEVVTIQPARMFGAEVTWFDNERARILDRERAVLDLFVRVREFGGIGTALDMLEAHRSKVRINHLIAHALTLDVASVTKRLGWSLERLGVGHRQLRALLEVRASAYNLLDPSRPATGKREARWQIRNNLETAA